MRAIALRCEHREDVPCVDDPAPRLSWALESDREEDAQTAYRIVVGDLWDSGRVESHETVDIPYRGPPLPPGAELEWAVQV
jgi:alpha-L-rhamnosidase